MCTARASAKSSNMLAHSLDHLVGAGEQRGRHGEAERSRGFEVDDQFQLGRKFNRQIPRLGALQNLDNVGSSTLVVRAHIDAVTDQAADVDMVAKTENGW